MLIYHMAKPMKTLGSASFSFKQNGNAQSSVSVLTMDAGKVFKTSGLDELF